MKKLFILVIICLSYNLASACQCPLTTLNDKELAKYEIIFKGSIQSIRVNNSTTEAVFHVSELYKGLIADDFKIIFNNDDECKVDIRIGDEWIIYSNYFQVDKAKLDYCSRSRRYIKNINEDFYAETTGISYDQEIRFLQNTLGLHKPLKNNPNKVENRNIIPNTNQLIVYLLISIVGIIFFYLVVNKLFKKYN